MGTTIKELIMDELEYTPEPIYDTTKLTGGSSDYYEVEVKKPTKKYRCSYTAECNDIIEALNLNFAEGNIMKALWRRAKARMGGGKVGTTSLYDAEKCQFFSERLVEQEKED